MLKWNNHLLQQKKTFPSKKRCLPQVPKGRVWAPDCPSTGRAHGTASPAKAHPALPERLWAKSTPSSRTNYRWPLSLLESSSSSPSRELFLVQKVPSNLSNHFLRQGNRHTSPGWQRWVTSAIPCPSKPGPRQTNQSARSDCCTVQFQTDDEHSRFIYSDGYFRCWWLSKVLCMAIALLFKKKKNGKTNRVRSITLGHF